ncbi:MAG: MarR family transcriptional regulator [Candidatus Marinimicrobia bacterium]|nr:MarR family transcriptional regulator [Candidatus Neomarinimicrobiota bacterium]
MNNTETNNFEFRILIAIRRVIRSVDVYSRKIHAELGLTTPQLLCLDALKKNDHMITKELAKTVNLSESTVIGIIDRLEAKQYVLRNRSLEDRRKVYLTLTEAGKGVLQETPSLLQDKFSFALAKLDKDEQNTITLSLERIVELMEAEDLVVSPNLLPHAEIEIK